MQIMPISYSKYVANLNLKNNNEPKLSQIKNPTEINTVDSVNFKSKPGTNLSRIVRVEIIPGNAGIQEIEGKIKYLIKPFIEKNSNLKSAYYSSNLKEFMDCMPEKIEMISDDNANNKIYLNQNYLVFRDNEADNFIKLEKIKPNLLEFTSHTGKSFQAAKLQYSDDIMQLPYVSRIVNCPNSNYPASRNVTHYNPDGKSNNVRNLIAGIFGI